MSLNLKFWQLGLFSKSSRRFLLRFNIMWQLICQQSKKKEVTTDEWATFSSCLYSAIVSVCNIKTTSSKPSDWLVGGVLRNKLGQCSGNQAFAAALDFPFVTLHCKPLRQQLWTGCCQTWSVNRVQYYFRLFSKDLSFRHVEGKSKLIDFFISSPDIAVTWRSQHTWVNWVISYSMQDLTVLLSTVAKV